MLPSFKSQKLFAVWIFTFSWKKSGSGRPGPGLPQINSQLELPLYKDGTSAPRPAPAPGSCRCSPPPCGWPEDTCQFPVSLSSTFGMRSLGRLSSRFPLKPLPASSPLPELHPSLLPLHEPPSAQNSKHGDSHLPFCCPGPSAGVWALPHWACAESGPSSGAPGLKNARTRSRESSQVPSWPLL